MTTYTDNKATAPELNMYDAVMHLDRCMHNRQYKITDLDRAVKAAKQSVYRFTLTHPGHVDEEVMSTIHQAEDIVADYQLQVYLERTALQNMAKKGQ